MRDLWRRTSSGGGARRRFAGPAYLLVLGTAMAALGALGAPGCGGGDTGSGGGTGGTGGKPTTSTSTTGTGDTSGTSTTTTGTGGTGGTGTGGSDAGTAKRACETTVKGSTRGSAIALTPDDSRLVVVNRDRGTVTVMSVDYSDGQPKMSVVKDAQSNDEIDVGGEPWQVVIDGCGKRAYVILRKDQKVVAIDNLDGTPSKGGEIAVGSEPSGIAISPNNFKLYVSNWVDGTLSVIDLSDAAKLQAAAPVDLNATLAATGLLGDGLASRPALAHPRGVAITNNGDGSDDDESVLVTEWFAQRTAPLSADGKNADTNRKGLLYKVEVADGAVTTVDLPSVADTGFNDHLNQKTGCYPNQIASVSIDNGFAYVTSTCASPVGPIGTFQKGACTTNAQCANINAASVCTNGACTLACAQDSDCGFGSPAGTCNLGAGGTCAPIPTDFKTNTHPAVSIVDLAAGTATTVNLDKLFVAKNSARIPLLPQDIDFRPGFAYTVAEGTDAVFRLVLDNGQISDVGSPNNQFIDLHTSAADKLLRLPIGVATHHTQAFAFVASHGSRDVTALNLSSQTIAGTGANDLRITPSAALPAPNTPEESVLKGRRFFVTGLGRWSLGGQGWGSCEACHVDGLTDNVTWYFARGPRQSTSLDGSYASKDATDRRIFNWTAIFDETADFELNTRGTSGGVGAIVKAQSDPPVNGDRINLLNPALSPPQQGLLGSTQHIATPTNQQDAHPEHSLLNDWNDIDAYLQTIRSPRRPTNLVAADVAEGKKLFTQVGQGNCVGCHSGAKWTISKVFYPVGDTANASPNTPGKTSLSEVSWNANLNGFPTALWPINPAPPLGSGTANPANDARMRFGAPPAFEQIQCILRPVGTFGTSPVDGNDMPQNPVVEVRADMTTPAQGNADTGRGYNPPSLLGLQIGAPFFHAGNARTLEEVFNVAFKAHYQSAIATVFNPNDPSNPDQIRQLVAYLLSIDEDEPVIAIPALGASGGDICHYP